MSIANAYSAWAERYDLDRNLTRDLDAEVTRQRLGGERRGVVVEAGCGTGKNTRFFSGIADEVQALDFSEGMLAVARRRVGAPSVRFIQADLTAPWPVAPGRADLVSFNLVLEHIAELQPVLAQAARSLAVDGRVFISELHPFKQYQNSQARFVDATGQEVRVQAWTHHLCDFLAAARACSLALERLDEWWHPDDPSPSVPRLVTFELRRAAPDDGPQPRPGSERKASLP